MQPDKAGGADIGLYSWRHGLSDPSSSFKRSRLDYVGYSVTTHFLSHSITLCQLFHARCRNNSLVDPYLLRDFGVSEHQVWL